MTAHDDKAQDDASHKHKVSHDRALNSARDKTQQGVVKDERGQEQPSDKKRATENR